MPRRSTSSMLTFHAPFSGTTEVIDDTRIFSTASARTAQSITWPRPSGGVEGGTAAGAEGAGGAGGAEGAGAESANGAGGAGAESANGAGGAGAESANGAGGAGAE